MIARVMSRLIQIDNPTNIRNRNRRTIAELLRRLPQKQEIDDEAKDMAATIVLLLHEIYVGVEQSAAAWEKKDYWMKAERFMRDWRWTAEISADMDDVIRHDAWDLLPELLADLYPRFEEMEIKSMTRDASAWKGGYKKLMANPPLEHPW
jgi:hypothetical protein